MLMLKGGEDVDDPRHTLLNFEYRTGTTEVWRNIISKHPCE